MPRAKKSAAKQATLFEPAVKVELTKENMERWHKDIAQAGAILALTLARRRRSPTMARDIVDLLEPMLQELKETI